MDLTNLIGVIRELMPQKTHNITAGKVYFVIIRWYGVVKLVKSCILREAWCISNMIMSKFILYFFNLLKTKIILDKC